MDTRTDEGKMQVYKKRVQSNKQLVKRREGARKERVRNTRVTGNKKGNEAVNIQTG